MPTAPVVLHESAAPNGFAGAVVEADARCVFLYMFAHGGARWPVRSCWVRNLAPAPSEVDVEAMRDGVPPMMPRRWCRHPEGSPLPDAGKLEIVWFEDGDGLALFEGDELLAVVPSWSGERGFHGFARDCDGDGPLAWGLAEGLPVLGERVAAARSYWTEWTQADAWRTWRNPRLARYEAALGASSNYYAIDGGTWPTRALLRIPRGEAMILITSGIAFQPQLLVDRDDDARTRRRIEFGLAMSSALLDGSELDRWIAAQSTLPWRQRSWLGHGHTIGCDIIPRGASSTSFEAFLLVQDPTDLPRLALPEYRGDEIHVLWLVPITAAERALAERDGSAALLARLVTAGHGAIHRDRESVA